MARFNMKPDTLTRLAGNMGDYAWTVRGIGNGVGNVRGSLNFSDEIKRAVGYSLQCMVNEIYRESAGLEDMSSGLLGAVRGYRNTEDQISGKAKISWDGIMRWPGNHGVADNGKLLVQWNQHLLDGMNIPEEISAGLAQLSQMSQMIGKYGKNDSASLASSALGYLSTLCGIASGKERDGLDIFKDTVSMGKSSIDAYTGLYKYYEKTLNPFEATRLGNKFGTRVKGISIMSKMLGAVNKGIDSYQIYADSESTSFDKAAQTIKLMGGVVDLAGNTYIASQATNKALRFVSSAGGSKAINQILTTNRTLKYTTSSAVTKSIDKVSTWLAVCNVVTDTVAGGVKRYGQVMEDGKWDLADAGSVGLYGGLGGLNTVVSTLTLGLAHFDSEEVARDLERRAMESLKGDSWASNYVKDQSNHLFFRFGVSMGMATDVLCKKVASDVSEGTRIVGSWVSNAWNFASSMF